MVDFIKRQKIGFYLTAAAAILTIVGLITLCVSNSVQGYGFSDTALLIVATVAALLLIAGKAYLADRFGSQHWVVAIVNIVVVLLLCFAFYSILLQRADLAASLFSYDSVNKVGWSAFTPSVVSLITFLLSCILVATAAFFKQDAAN